MGLIGGSPTSSTISEGVHRCFNVVRGSTTARSAFFLAKFHCYLNGPG